MGSYYLQVREGKINEEGKLTKESKRRLEELAEFFNKNKNMRGFEKIGYSSTEESEITAKKLRDLIGIEEVENGSGFSAGVSSSFQVLVKPDTTIADFHADTFRKHDNYEESKEDFNLKPGEGYFWEEHHDWLLVVMGYFPCRGKKYIFYTGYDKADKVEKAIDAEEPI